MCGICGYSGEKNDKLMAKMLERMRHRGPNDSGCYMDRNRKINIGMVRLSIIDLHGGHQPISNEDGAIRVVFNGEIYNYIELRDELERKGHRFKTLSDTETIVHAYEEYGLSFPDKLNGMFAIGIWDLRENKLILIRDRFGIKPLFYAHRPGMLVFGSEIKVLLSHPDVSRDIDYEALSHYFSLRNIPAPFTVYKSIKALLPGQMLIWDGKRCEISGWYKLDMETKWGDDDEDVLIDRINELLRDSVRLRLRSDVEYGAYLSGGMDSSTVVGIMSEFSKKPVKTFSLSYADSPGHKQDAHFARKVARRYSTEHHEYVMGWNDLQREMPEVIRHLDQPFAGVISSYWLSRFMSKYVTVALSGDGADDTFASYGHHRLIAPIAAAQRVGHGGGSIDEADLGFFKEKEGLVRELAQRSPWEWRLSYASFMEHEKEMLFSAKGKDAMMPYSTSEFFKDVYLRCVSGTDELNRMLYLDINTLLPNEILYFNDMLSMRNSMEVRTPFLDFRLVELACSIPGTLKIKGMSLKYILRKVASRYLPDEILKRPKEGFVLPKNTWLRQGMAPMLRDVLSKDRIAIHGYLNHEYVDSLIKDFFAGNDTLTFKVWSLMVFQVWYENHLKI
ncbi:MAG: asparagine synthase (glutamine-hydrolyzing) [Candidatus Omnitrophica bacterium]|nr:asparagine synthase (glutamine-hydrolyzing) [Candidatus Omnitrophota bacterium]